MAGVFGRGEYLKLKIAVELHLFQQVASVC